jgi:hypothetical protein
VPSVTPTPGGHHSTDDEVIRSIKALPSTGESASLGGSNNLMLIGLLMAASTLLYAGVMIRLRRQRQAELERARVRVRSRRIH